MSKASAKKNRLDNLVAIDKAVIRAEAVEKVFQNGGENLAVLKQIDFTIERGEMVALVGPSGSGKSTLLHIAGLLDRPSAGRVVIGGRDASQLSDKGRTELRREKIGFVYQYHHLQPEFSALENVVLPQLIAGKSKKEARENAEDLLTTLGLKERLSHRPARLSGGEQQRVAIARALANNPQLLLADEPTGNLDMGTSDDVFKLLVGLVRERGIGALIATHNLDLADRMDRILELKGGRILSY